MKKLIAIFVALVMVLFSVAALAETKITVNGTGEVRVSADTAIISLGVNARDKDVLKAQQRVNETIAAIRTALIEQGVKEENINTDFINIYPLYDYSNDQEQLAAYNASSTLAIKVTDMESVGTLIDVCFAAGANTLNGISFSASDTEEAKTEAMKKAVTDAKKKAEILAEASGLKITGIEIISEGGVYSYQNNVGNVYSRAAGMEEPAMEEDAGTVVQSAKLIVSASVSITFEAE
ncbi:MAG: SIMPL domain-containing protein [Oscillospiraceae bacterium]|nr:SIMPL domain-containing protein [Oscillospiraceae bacterium]